MSLLLRLENWALESAGETSLYNLFVIINVTMNKFCSLIILFNLIKSEQTVPKWWINTKFRVLKTISILSHGRLYYILSSQWVFVWFIKTLDAHLLGSLHRFLTRFIAATNLRHLPCQAKSAPSEKWLFVLCTSIKWKQFLINKTILSDSKSWKLS